MRKPPPFSGLPLTSEEARAYLKKRTEGGKKANNPFGTKGALIHPCGRVRSARAYLRTGNFPRAPIWRLCRNKGLHPLRRLRGYPCTPTKTVHPPLASVPFLRVWLSYREVIPIAIYHCNIGIVSRGKGKSAVAAAAYRSGEKITNEWDGMTHDYTRKRGVVHTEILLPPHAPPSFSDRSTLWNSVELYEKAGNASLPERLTQHSHRLSREEQIRLVREYCSSQFVSRGMCVDFAIHDTDSGNPHCHIMLTMRPLTSAAHGRRSPKGI